MINEINTKQIKLFRSLQYIRLQYDKCMVEDEIKKNQKLNYSQSDGFFKGFFNALGDDIKVNKLNKLYVIQKNIDDEICRFKNNINNELFGFQELGLIINDIFKNDIYLLEKHIFSTSVILDGEYCYQYANESLKYISDILWNQSDFLHNMKNNIENTYKDLAKQTLSTNQKLILGGTAALVLLTAAVPALTLGGLSATGITSGLAGFGMASTMVEGVGLIALTELLLDGAIIGFTYMLLDSHNKKMVKKSFREMNYNHAAKMLAIRCYIMNVAKQNMPVNVFKEKTSELLQMLQDLKSDTDYVLLVEKQNIEENRKKIQVFHNLDNKLAKMLCE